MRKSSWYGTGMSEAAARFDLPARSVFEPPSYPNVWFYVHERVAASQDAAVSLVTGWLRDHCGITNDFPYCGRTGAYAGADDLFAGVHEPLGLELLLDGTIRGQPVSRSDGRPVGGIALMKETHALQIERVHPARADMNIVGLAVVLI